MSQIPRGSCSGLAVVDIAGIVDGCADPCRYGAIRTVTRCETTVPVQASKSWKPAGVSARRTRFV